MASPQLAQTSDSGSGAMPICLQPSRLSLASKLAVTTAEVTDVAGDGMVSPVTVIGPRKQWIVPPRPKPGRKPATDTPPTKRKAQNRAAQRAFRERRAARVGELEEQLKETEDEHLKQEAVLQEDLTKARREIQHLEAEVRRCTNDIVEWRGLYDAMEQKFNFERKDKEAAIAELAYLRHGARSTGTSAVPLPPRRSKQATRTAALPTITASNEHKEILGCGDCTHTASCACVEQALAIAPSCGSCSEASPCKCLGEALTGPSSHTSIDADAKRPSSLHDVGTDTKRPRLSVEEESHEIDFTYQFLSRNLPDRLQNPQSLDTASVALDVKPSLEACGFCTEGSYCVCADAIVVSEREHENRLPPLLNEVTPPLSDSDVTSADANGSKLPLLYPNHRVHHALSTSKDLAVSQSNRQSTKTASSCIDGPGSCQQCLDDPKSGLFCRSLAAMRASTTALPSGCCGGRTTGLGCCKTQQPELPAPALSCADTYKTLASHRNFDRASDELSNWLPKLNSVAPRYPGRAALDIEAASVMNVIKYFDVRFGRD